MTAPPVPATVSVGQKLSAALWNAQVRDVLNFLLSKPRCYVYQTAAQTLTTGVWAVVPLDTEVYDTDTMHDPVTLNTRVVATTSGLYRVNAQVCFVANATGGRLIQLNKNSGGSQAVGLLQSGRQWAASAAGTAFVELTVDVQLAAGDYVELFAQQGSGGNLNTVGGSQATFVQAELVESS